MTSTCSRSFLYLCVACWMRSLTVHPSLQGTTTPVCPNVTVTFIIALSASSKMQAPLDVGWWTMAMMIQTLDSPPESVDKEAGIRKDGFGSKAKKKKNTQTNFFKSHTACQSGPESIELLTKTARCVYCLSMPFLPTTTHGVKYIRLLLLSHAVVIRVIAPFLISSHLLKQHPTSVDTIHVWNLFSSQKR